jgi:hypothetical protein
MTLAYGCADPADSGDDSTDGGSSTRANAPSSPAGSGSTHGGSTTGPGAGNPYHPPADNSPGSAPGSAPGSGPGTTPSGPGTAPSEPGGGGPFSYQFAESDCTTGLQRFASIRDLCVGLTDEELNHDCALSLRQKLYLKDHCFLILVGGGGHSSSEESSWSSSSSSSSSSETSESGSD